MDFSHLVLQWYDRAGRHDLPWQKQQTPYRVWVSEIMLQQTQVSTVIPYFIRFMQQFPTVSALATAPLDDVLHHWSGLGYYARARNLHRTAQIICEKYQGRFPRTVARLEALPGIGRSTAGAIISLSSDIPATILDGNVKRLLTRFYAFDENLTKKTSLDKLWLLAEKLTPSHRCRDYNQAMMDLGALICTRNHPQCDICPLAQDCLANKNGIPEAYPVKKIQTTRPRKEIFLLLLRDQMGNILLEKRPPSGIWGGLWSFPECDDANKIKELCHAKYKTTPLNEIKLARFMHIFTHFELVIKPILIAVKVESNYIMDSKSLVWYNGNERIPGGIPAPIAKILKTIKVTV